MNIKEKMKMSIRRKNIEKKMLHVNYVNQAEQKVDLSL